MKKIILMLAVFAVAFSSLFTVYAADGKVIYDGNAKNFIFEPGSEHSLTDLFPEFKNVMPGDSLTQKITVKNKADKGVKVKVYIRSLGAHKDSADFLSKLELKVKKSQQNDMAYMFDASSNETAQLTDWVCLGTLYSGGEVNLDVILNVPVQLDNQFKNKVGYLDWEFKIEEFPIEPDDPKPPQTGDDFNIGLWIVIMVCSVFMIVTLIVWSKKKNRIK